MNRFNLDRRNRDRSFDKRLDQLIEAGRQVVDGVAGNRPGKRNLGSIEGNSLSRFSNVSSWVEDKLDWLLEDNEDWMEGPLNSNTKLDNLNEKKPLEAISQRNLKDFDKNTDFQKVDSSVNDEWPEESTFKLNKWTRDHSKENEDPQISSKNLNSSRRPLPRSSRKRL